MKCSSLRTLSFAPSSRAEASRSNSAPVDERPCQPSPTITAVSPGASLVSETFAPLPSVTLIRPLPETSARSVQITDRSRAGRGPRGKMGGMPIEGDGAGAGLPHGEWDAARQPLPILYVDAVPVRVDEFGE